MGSDRYFVKRFGFASDWIMRPSGDRVGRQYLVWQAGIMDQAPGCIDHTVVAMSVSGMRKDAVLRIVMREVGGLLCRRERPWCQLASTLGSSRAPPPRQHIPIMDSG